MFYKIRFKLLKRMFCWRKMIEKFLLEMPQLTLGHFQCKRGKNDNFDLCFGNFFWKTCWSNTQSCKSKSQYIKF
jgi:hypothetical protein